MADHDEAQALQQMNAMLEQTVPRAHDMGVRFVELRRGFVRTEVPYEGNGNHFGVIYAGVTFTLAEVLGGGMAFASFDPVKFFPLVRGMTIAFTAPGTGRLTASTSLTDEQIVAIRAEAEERGKANFVLEATVTGEDGTVVATTRGDYQIRALDR